MSDAFEDTKLYRRFKAQPGVPDRYEDQLEAHLTVRDALEPLGINVPSPYVAKLDDDAYLTLLGNLTAKVGPTERKDVDIFSLPASAKAEWIKQGVDIARAEIDHPRYSLKPGELREVVKIDRAGREVKEFYSDEATGVKPWFNQFKGPVVKYVSTGSQGIATENPSAYYSFDKANIVPEYVELQRRAAFADSAEGKLIAAYAAVDKIPPEEILAKIRGK
jgi:hypothetical protein